MGDVEKAAKKVEKATIGEAKKAIKKVGEIGQDIIDVTVKPTRDLAKATAQGATNLAEKVGENPELLLAGASAYLGGPQLLGQAQGLLDRKEVTTNTATPIVVNGGGTNDSNSNQNIILIVGGIAIALVLFMSLKKR